MTAQPRPQLELSENARVVLERRYLAKDEAGNLVETPEQLFRRVAANIAEAERFYQSATRSANGSSRSRGSSPSLSTERASGGEVEERFYDLMGSLRFLPN